MMAMGDKTESVMLSELLGNWLVLPPAMECALGGITQDSRDVIPGYLFLACKGQTVNGVEFIDKAIEKGAIAVVWESDETTAAIPFSTRQTSQGKDVPVIALDGLS